MASTCPECGAALEKDARVCRHCLAVVDRDAGQHDAGRLGADSRGGGHPLEDPPVGPIPMTAGGLEGGVLGSVLRLVPAGLLARGRGRKRRDL